MADNSRLTQERGLKKLRRVTAKSPEFNCDNCGCKRYSKCGCKRKMKTA